jgi:hypothetical protein
MFMIPSLAPNSNGMEGCHRASLIVTKFMGEAACLTRSNGSAGMPHGLAKGLW